MHTKLETIIEQAGIPGISVVTVSKDNKPVIENAGVANNETQKEVANYTVFEAASLSKPIFAYIVLKMAERGDFDLNKFLHLYYPKKNDDEQYNEKNGFGPPFSEIREHPNYDKLTASMILSHQAGLPNEFLPKETNPKELDFKFIKDDLGKFDYSGEAYRFLMDVIQKESGKDLEKLAQEEFARIGMEHSSFQPPNDASIQAVGHLRDGTADKERHFYAPHPAASLYTTAEDYGLFLKACLEDPFVRKYLFEPIVHELTDRDKKAMDAHIPNETLNQIAWGLGIGLQKNIDGTLTAFHWGDGNKTCRNFTAINLKTNQAFACFTNSANGPDIFKQLAEPVVGSLDFACQWLYMREGFNKEKAQHYKSSLEGIKNIELSKQGSKENSTPSSLPK